MTRRAGWVVMVLWSSTALAGSVNGHLSGTVAWTNDSRYLVYFGNMTSACDVQTNECADVDESWEAKHPSTKASPSRESPDGKGEATVTVSPGASGDGTWAGNTWTPASESRVELGVLRDGKKTVSSVFTGSIHTLDVYWSPDKRRVAWVIRPSAWSGMDGSTSVEVEVGSAGLPRIQLLADASILVAAFPVARKALDAAGFVVTGQGKAVKARPASVVYFARGQDALAKSVALALPGGATTEKLSWKANAEVVVALGSSLLKGGKP